ncbi:recombinase family protein [Nocardia aurantiaca]|uniref:Resolvase/invertase-type recombinase catalytic domain-containing protein n=1 Tax=Nocardia aurantiaca TaxID=2675850 RepID=A0A6I3L4J4_9NOCA|nr:hypothetical protein [Nocardia aurantiaca]MTE16441.1 hypothetical protein [Nocardia aurantiaca]
MSLSAPQRKGRKLDRQLLALRAAGCRKIFSDKKSDTEVEREQLAECLGYLRPATPW